MARKRHGKQFVVVTTDDFNKKSISRKHFSTKTAAKQHADRQKKEWLKANPLTGHYYKFKVVEL